MSDNTCNIYLLKVNIRTTKKGVKHVKSQQYKRQDDVIDIVLVFLLLTLNIFRSFF